MVSDLPPQGYGTFTGMFPVPIISTFVNGTLDQLQLLCEALTAVAELIARSV